MAFRNKRVLITAGPTWVAIDPVRVISNTATGETGILLAEKLQQLGAKVTLLLGPVGVCCLHKKIRLIRYKFFRELKEEISKELKTGKYAAMIHCAAVSDYQPRTLYRRKIKSNVRHWQLALKPTEKIINLIKKLAPSLLLAGFKFEPQAEKALLLKEAKELIRRARLDFAVANTVTGGKYRAYIMDNLYRVRSEAASKAAMVKALVKIIGG